MKNLLKMKLEKGEIAVGTIVTLGHPDIIELFSYQGYSLGLVLPGDGDGRL